jgi:pimeloyl-ACP methyl ester carboxylesterase
MTNLDNKIIELDEVNLRYIEIPGPGLPLVLLHGVTGSLEAYLPLFEELGQIAHIYALDFRGHGLSGHVHAPDEYRVQDYGQDLQRFLKTVVGKPVVLAGHSLGGLIATWTAAQPGATIRGVLLEDPPMYKALMPAVKSTVFYPIFINLRHNLQAHLESGASSESWTEQIAAWPYDDKRTMLEAVGPEGVRLRAWQLHQLDPFVLDSVLAGTLTVDFIPDDLLPQITCPVHLLAGRYDLGSAMDEADVRRVVSLLPRCTYAIFEDTGHRIHQEKPARYMQELRQFLNSL